jgi:uncharacterized protein (TIGR02145 family)
MNKIYLFFAILSINIEKSRAQVVDIDGNVYKTERIGVQHQRYSTSTDGYGNVEVLTDSFLIWTTSNLNVSKFRNGESIKEAKTSADWEDALNKGIPAWCYYGNNSQNGKEYGKLYNYYAITSLKGLAPKGWHIANEKDWEILFSTLKINITEANLWADEKVLLSTSFKIPTGYGDNKSGLNIKPSGYCRGGDNCNDFGSYSYIWLINGLQDGPCKIFGGGYNYSFEYFDAYRGGYSVRCVKNW